MAKPTGFLEADREEAPSRAPSERVGDWREFHHAAADDRLRTQASRCMDCGVPFCHAACPLGNLIPDWNDLAWRDRWREAIESLHRTNNFPEFTGRVCPAPCEAACVLAIDRPAVSIERIEEAVAERAWAEGWIVPQPAAVRTGRRVAVVGSGPAGLAGAQQLARAGHDVTVFERAARPGGLLRYGIPAYKLEKRVIDRRLAQMEAEGVRFACGAGVGAGVDPAALRAGHDAVVLCVGATLPRDLGVPGRGLRGVHFAMDFLGRNARAAAGEAVDDPISAAGKDVVVVGGGDTGADCVGTSIRQGARSLTQLEILPKPPEAAGGVNPDWPRWPRILRRASAHEEAEAVLGARAVFHWGVATTALEGENGEVRRLRAARVEWAAGPDGRSAPREVAGSAFEIPAGLVLLAMGFTGAERAAAEALGAALDERGNVRTRRGGATDAPGVFAAGDAAVGQSLVVRAIAEGRRVARSVDLHLMGETTLPEP